jgi:hypothetical protein
MYKLCYADQRITGSMAHLVAKNCKKTNKNKVEQRRLLQIKISTKMKEYILSPLVCHLLMQQQLLVKYLQSLLHSLLPHLLRSNTRKKIIH